MQQVDITFLRALKILLSWTWRVMVLTFPLAFVLALSFYFLDLFPKPGMTPEQMQKNFAAGKIFIVWIVMFASSICIYCTSIIWLLKTKWSDFRLIAVDPGQK